jgi:hypothetical protein
MRAFCVNTGERNLIPDAWAMYLPRLAGKSETVHSDARKVQDEVIEVEATSSVSAPRWQQAGNPRFY